MSTIPYSTPARPEASPARPSPKKIWIDLDNSPHVPFFTPIIEALQNLGHSVIVTARDFAQVCEMADLLGLRYQKVGRHFGKNMAAKFIGIAARAMQLAPLVARAKPDLAVSHGSRSQLLLSTFMRIPAITIGDYEHARIFALVRPRWVIVPEVIPVEAMHVPPQRVLTYPGIKEDVYMPRFKPDKSILAALVMKAEDVVITIRPPATHAHYHNPESDVLFAAVMDRIIGDTRARAILLPRTPGQAKEIRQRWNSGFASGRMMIPEHVIDGMNLIWFSDLVISGGGTMNREAAALGVPVYSTFRGKIGAVDHYLAAQNRLTLIENVQDVQNKIEIVKRNRNGSPHGDGATLNSIVGNILMVMEKECQRA